MNENVHFLLVNSLNMDLHIYTFEELKWHACHFILSKWQSFTDLNGTIRAVSNLQWSNM
jgi:hypothetical protein